MFGFLIASFWVSTAQAVDRNFIGALASGKKPQTITWNTQPSAMTVGDADQNLVQASSSSGLAITYSTSTTDYCTVVAGPKLRAVAAGDCVVHADQAGNGHYFAAAQLDSGNVTISGGGCSTPAGGVMKEGFETPGKELTWTDSSGTPTWNYASPGTPPAGVCSYSARFQGSEALTYATWDNGSNITVGTNGIDYQISLYIASVTMEAFDAWPIAKAASNEEAYDDVTGSQVQIISDGGGSLYGFRVRSSVSGESVFSDPIQASAGTGWFVLKVHLDQAAAANGSSIACLSGCTSTTPITFQRSAVAFRYFNVGPMTSADAVGEAFDMSFGYVVVNQTP